MDYFIGTLSVGLADRFVLIDPVYPIVGRVGRGKTQWFFVVFFQIAVISGTLQRTIKKPIFIGLFWT